MAFTLHRFPAFVRAMHWRRLAVSLPAGSARVRSTSGAMVTLAGISHSERTSASLGRMVEPILPVLASDGPSANHPFEGCHLPLLGEAERVPIGDIPIATTERSRERVKPGREVEGRPLSLGPEFRQGPHQVPALHLRSKRVAIVWIPVGQSLGKARRVSLA